MVLYLLAFVLALLLALYGVPVARRAALQFNVVDRPDGRLKHQSAPVPYFGGLAVYLAFLVSLALTFEFRQDVLGLVLGGTLMVMLGLIDDFGVLEPWPKLIGQLIAVFVLIRSGIRIEIAAFPDWLDLLLTVMWMIGIINAVNIIVVMDGRRLRGLPMFLGSLDHFALRLRQLRLSVHQVVGASYGASVALGGAALAMIFVATATALIIAGVAVLLAVVAAVWLTRVEMPRPAKGAVVPPAPESVRRAP